MKLALVLLVCSASACATLNPPPPRDLSKREPEFLVVGTAADQTIAAQQHCGNQSWSLKPRHERDGVKISDGTESYVVCSGYE